MTPSFSLAMIKTVKKISVAISSLFAFLLFPGAAYAQQLCPPGPFAPLCTLKLQNSSGVVGGIIGTIWVIAVIVTLFFLVWGGIRWISSGGDKAKIEQARSTIIAALIGMAISFLAFFIVNFVFGIFTGQDIGTVNVPKLVK